MVGRLDGVDVVVEEFLGVLVLAVLDIEGHGVQRTGRLAERLLDTLSRSRRGHRAVGAEKPDARPRQALLRDEFSVRHSCLFQARDNQGFQPFECEIAHRASQENTLTIGVFVLVLPSLRMIQFGALSMGTLLRTIPGIGPQ